MLNESSYTVLMVGQGLLRELDVTLPTPYEVSLWNKVGKFYTLEGFFKDPVNAWKHYKDLYLRIENANKHKIIEHLKTLFNKGYIQSMITTCINGFSELIETGNIIELYGSILKSHCTTNEHSFKTRDVIDKFPEPLCPYDKSPVRPSITFYNENIKHREWLRALIEVESAELVLVLSSNEDEFESPVNMLPILAKLNGSRLIVVNETRSLLKDIADVFIEHSLLKFIEKLAKIL